MIRLVRPNSAILHALAAIWFLLAATAWAQKRSDPLPPDRCTAKANSIFLGTSEHDITMRKDFVDRCRIRERSKELRAKREAVEQPGSASSGKRTGWSTDR